MGLFDKLFPKKNQIIQSNNTWSLLNGYTPIFNSWRGELYESELVRAAIDSRSRHIAKLRVNFQGSAKPELINKLKQKPNDFQTWYQLIYRVNTILDMQNTAFLIPILGRYNEVTGITTMLPMMYELIDYNGEPWIRFQDYNGSYASIELSRVGILTKFQYKSDLFGSDNTALNQTMALIDIQQQGITEAIKNSNTYRFWAKSSNLVKTEDLKKERERFSKENFSGDGGGGLLLFPNIYSEIHQAESKPYTVDYNSMQMIQNSVFNYFAVSGSLIESKATPEEMDSFFCSVVEPFLIQFEEVMTKMIYTPNEIVYGNKVTVDSNRLKYMTTNQKVALVNTLSNVGALSVNEIRELFDYSSLGEKGEVIPTRGEYKDVGTLLTQNPSIKNENDNEEINSDKNGEE